jgi:hypothetical protein
MTLPNINISIADGGLGTAPPSVDRVWAVVGCSSSGTAAQIVGFSNPADIPASAGYGPGPEAVAYVLQAVGGICYYVKAATATSGTATAVTHVGSVGDGVMAVTGTPYDKYSVVVEITATGEAGVATFKYSLDGGDTYSPNITVPSGSPGTYAIANTGMTLTFTDGVGAASWGDGDTYTFTTTAPETDTTGLGNALAALRADPREWRFVHVVGNSTPYSAGTGYGPCTTIDTQMTSAENAYRYTYAIAEARDIGQGTSETEAQWISSLVTGLANFVSKRTAVFAGTVKIESGLPQVGKTYMRRSAAWAAVAQRLALARGDDSGFAAKTGAMPGVNALYHDEEITPGLDAGRFSTARTIVGQAGYYISHIRMFASAGSDFEFVQARECMDEACRAARQGYFKFLNADLRVDEVTGYIDERDAQEVDNYTDAIIDAALGDNVTSSSVVTARTDNILSTKLLRGTVSIKPKAYAKSISLTIGFRNPAIKIGG